MLHRFYDSPSASSCTLVFGGVRGVEWKGNKCHTITAAGLPSLPSLSVPPSLATSSSLLWRAMRQSLPCSCLHSGPSSSPLTYIFNMRSGAASGLHFGLCGGGNFQSNNDLFFALPKKVVRPSGLSAQMTFCLFSGHSVRSLSSDYIAETEVKSECAASFCLWDRPHFLLLRCSRRSAAL